MSFDFDARAVQPQQPMSAVPIGWYQAIIESDEQKPTKANDGSQQLVQTFQLLKNAEGNTQFAGRKLFNRLQLWNKSEQAREIATKELSAQCHVTGQLVLLAAQGGTRLLWNKPMYIEIGMDETGKYNEIKGYKDLQGNDPGKQGQGGQPAMPPAMPPAAPPPAGPSPFGGAAPAGAAPGGFPAPAQAPAPAAYTPAPPPQFGPPGGPPSGYPAAAPGGWGGAPGAAPGGPAAPGMAPPGNWGPAAGAAAPTGFPPAAPAPMAPQAPAPAAWTPPAGAAPAGGAPWGR